MSGALPREQQRERLQQTGGGASARSPGAAGTGAPSIPSAPGANFRSAEIAAAGSARDVAAVLDPIYRTGMEAATEQRRREGAADGATDALPATPEPIDPGRRDERGRIEDPRLTLPFIPTAYEQERQRVLANRYSNQVVNASNDEMERIRGRHRNNPDGFREEATAYIEGMVKALPEGARATAAGALTRLSGSHYNSLLAERTQNDRAAAQRELGVALGRHGTDQQDLIASGRDAMPAQQEATARILSAFTTGVITPERRDELLREHTVIIPARGLLRGATASMDPTGALNLMNGLRAPTQPGQTPTPLQAAWAQLSEAERATVIAAETGYVNARWAAVQQGRSNTSWQRAEATREDIRTIESMDRGAIPNDPNVRAAAMERLRQNNPEAWARQQTHQEERENRRQREAIAGATGEVARSTLAALGSGDASDPRAARWLAWAEEQIREGNLTGNQRSQIYGIAHDQYRQEVSRQSEQEARVRAEDERQRAAQLREAAGIRGQMDREQVVAAAAAAAEGVPGANPQALSVLHNLDSRIGHLPIAMQASAWAEAVRDLEQDSRRLARAAQVQNEYSMARLTGSRGYTSDNAETRALQTRDILQETTGPDGRPLPPTAYANVVTSHLRTGVMSPMIEQDFRGAIASRDPEQMNRQIAVYRAAMADPDARQTMDAKLPDGVLAAMRLASQLVPSLPVNVDDAGRRSFDANAAQDTFRRLNARMAGEDRTQEASLRVLGETERKQDERIEQLVDRALSDERLGILAHVPLAGPASRALNSDLSYSAMPPAMREQVRALMIDEIGRYPEDPSEAARRAVSRARAEWGIDPTMVGTPGTIGSTRAGGWQHRPFDPASRVFSPLPTEERASVGGGGAPTTTWQVPWAMDVLRERGHPLASQFERPNLTRDPVATPFDSLQMMDPGAGQGRSLVLGQNAYWQLDAEASRVAGRAIYNLQVRRANGVFAVVGEMVDGIETANRPIRFDVGEGRRQRQEEWDRNHRRSLDEARQRAIDSTRSPNRRTTP